MTVDTLVAALGHPDVGAAFQGAAAGDSGTVLYGVDARPVDGALFFIERDGASSTWAPPAAPAPGECVNAPIGVQRLVDVLNALQEQESRRPVCAAALGDAGA